MADFWNSLLTEKSWNVLTELKKEKFGFIVIGGWAAYLWTKLHKSKDLDIALANIKDLDYLKQRYNLKKNENLKKYEIQFGDIDVDIYAPFYSKLAIPVEDLKEYTSSIESLTVASKEALLLLKQGAELQRKDSVKGLKDQIDLMALLCFAQPDFKIYHALLEKYHLVSYSARLRSIIQNFKDYSYLNLNPRELKLKKQQILQELRKQ